MGQNLVYVIVLDRHVLFRFAKRLVDRLYRLFQIVQTAFLAGNDFLPVPLVHIDGVDVVRRLVPADGAHVGVESFPVGKTVFAQSHAFPFREGVHDLCGGVVLLLDAEGDRAFHAV